MSTITWKHDPGCQWVWLKRVALRQTCANTSSHLINNGVDETPPSQPTSNGHSSAAAGPNPHDVFFGLESANVGFKQWHPVSVVEKGGKLCGQSDLGGVWEWTSSVLEKRDDFEPMKLYPGYTGEGFRYDNLDRG